MDLLQGIAFVPTSSTAKHGATLSDDKRSKEKKHKKKKRRKRRRVKTGTMMAAILQTF